MDCVAQMPMLHLKAAKALTRLCRDTDCWSWFPLWPSIFGPAAERWRGFYFEHIVWQGHLVWSEGMTVRGADFLYVWIDASITGEPGEQATAGALAAKLVADAAVAGFPLADMGLEDATLEDYLRETIAHLAEPETPGD